MPRKSPPLTLEEKSGEQFPNLHSAQQGGLSLLARGLVGIVRSLVEAGQLTIHEGRVVPSPLPPEKRENG